MNSSNNLTPEQKIDEILTHFRNMCVYFESQRVFPPDNCITQDEAKQQLLSLIQEEKIKELESFLHDNTAFWDKPRTRHQFDELIQDRLQALKQGE